MLACSSSVMDKPLIDNGQNSKSLLFPPLESKFKGCFPHLGFSTLDLLAVKPLCFCPRCSSLAETDAFSSCYFI